MKLCLNFKKFIKVLNLIGKWNVKSGIAIFQDNFQRRHVHEHIIYV
jgi:hypothetical protein